MTPSEAAWWRSSVVYQIYPRSFMDSDGDGVGDLRGIIAKLDYLRTLGVNVIWLCPVYPSPGIDGGYDISDYEGIAPEYGTMRDWEDLLEGLHQRGMRLIMDLVVNHTSDQHPWFVQARQSRDNPYRDYYIWRPGKANGPLSADLPSPASPSPPNNWGSHFGGPAWTLDEATGEYYLHLFAPQQPDLNWENPLVRREIYEMMAFWLDKGIDGFRMDTINMLSKEPEFPDMPSTGAYPYPLAEPHFLNGPRLLDYLREMKAEVLDHHDVLTVGETPGVDPAAAAVLTDPHSGPLNMIFQFDHMALDKDASDPRPRWTHRPWSLLELKRLISRWQTELHGRGWNSLYLGNHDVPRMVSRFGDDGDYRVPSAKLLATFLHTLQGTPFIYQGDEIGLPNVQFEHIQDYRDIDTLNFYREEVEERGQPVEQTLRMVHLKGRDNARTPMPWTASEQGGFTTGTPWLALHPQFPEINVQAALDDPDSVYWYYRALIKLRRQHPVMVDGQYELLYPKHPRLYAYTRTNQAQPNPNLSTAETPAEKLLVLLNFSAEPLRLGWPVLSPRQAALLIANYPAEPLGAAINLRPWEARVYSVPVP